MTVWFRSIDPQQPKFARAASFGLVRYLPVEDSPEIASSTPILDSGVMPPRPGRVRPQAVIGAVAVGVLLMELLAVAGGLWHEHWPAVLLLLILLGIAVHEIGHLIAGWAAGFHFNSLQIGPLFLEEDYGALRARLSLDMMYLGHSGMYAGSVRKLRRRLSIYIAGGPSANLLSFITIVLISHLLPVSDSSAATAAGEFGVISLILTLISVLPIGGSDGRLIEMLWRSPAAARRFMSTVALGSQFNRGIRARNWKQTWLRAVTYMPENSPLDFYAGWMAYLSASDRKDAAGAADYLERCISLTSPLTNRLRSLVAAEAFVHCAWFRGDPALSAKWLAQVNDRKSMAPVINARIEVALHCLRDDFDSAADACDEALTILRQGRMKPYMRASQESWVEWRSEIDGRKLQTLATQSPIGTKEGGK